MKAIKQAVAVGGLMVLGLVAQAAVPPVPTVQFYGTINGKTSIWITDTGDVTNYCFQTKRLEDGDTAWEWVDFKFRSKGPSAEQAFPDSLFFRRTADFSGVACFRVANTNAMGESAGWLTLGGTTNFLRHVGEAFGCNGNMSTANVSDGEVSTYYESNPSYSGTEFPWVGLKFDKPVTVSRIRFAPRSSDIGWKRLTGDVFQYADDAEFTNPVTIGTVPEAKNITGVSEIVLERPVTARYFRVLHLHVKDQYISIAEMELVAEGLTVLPELRVSCSDDYTNQYARVDWQVPEGVQCPSGIVQRSVSPAGPFADIGEWTVAGVKGSLVDKTAAIAVPYYYRLRLACEVPYLASEQHSDPVRYVRGRRLDRSWEDETTLLTGVSRMYPFIDFGRKIGNDLVKVGYAFDGETTSLNSQTHLCHYTSSGSTGYPNSNPSVGLDLGSPHHITGSLIMPWNTSSSANRRRCQEIAVYGADEEDLSDARQLTPTNGYFSVIDWLPNHVTNKNDLCRYVYFQTPTPSTFSWYGNVDEIRFFGYSDQDTAASGVLVPPTEIAVTADAVAMTVTWNAGYNVASYEVQRRKAGETDWTSVAVLAPPAQSYCDKNDKLAKGSYEFRVLATGTDGTTGLTVAAGCDFRPKRGMLLLFR